MAKIIRFPGAPEPPISWPEFSAEMSNDAVLNATVETIGKLTKAPTYSAAVDFDIREFSRSIPHGRVEEVVSRPHSIIATCAQFPNTLMDASDLDRQEALSVSAVFVNAFGIISSAIHRAAKWGMQIPTTPLPTSDVWEPMQRHPSYGRADVFRDRAAAKVALDANEHSPLQFAIENPLPSHLAALVEPISSKDFARLGPILKTR